MNIRLLIVLLLLVGFLIRTVGLEAVPPALNSDELLKAYDGASVYRTGQDHHGQSWPLFFRQSGEYSTPLYIYFVGLFSVPFGVHAYSVRLPSALLGTLAILFTYLLISEIFDKKTALLAAALVTISPWNVQYSRIGWEVISLIPLQLAGFLFFMRWNRKARLLELTGAAICFALTFYAYPTARVFTPLLLVAICILYRRELIAHGRHTITGMGIFLLILTPYGWTLVQHYHAMQARWMFLSVFQLENGWGLFGYHYLQHLSPMFLFFTGDANPLQAMPGGVGLAVLFPFFVVGLIVLLRRRDKISGIFLCWFLLFSIPSAMTFDRYDLYSMPNSLRSACGMPMLEIVSASGIFIVTKKINRYKIRKWLQVGIAVALLVNAGVVSGIYAIRSPIFAAPAFQFGIREVVEYAEAEKHKYDRVVVSPNVRLHPIYLAAFSGRPPSPFSSVDFPEYIIPFYTYVPVYRDFRAREFERYANIAQWYFLAPGKNLIVAGPNEISGVKPIKTIFYPDGSVAYVFFETNR
ncbi:MAG: phospholipid carrier-dependent glycosyltransferase [Candidatus Omnitrophota bacterium]|jgi:4-amino-4-deoxy-L-arabinose transferase-like glycosyltransferase|nr:MAG: phospholipid carrier-dependent glycosyltransferase [Candidatus Omnitrophota bacterium]